MFEGVCVCVCGGWGTGKATLGYLALSKSYELAIVNLEANRLF